MLLCNGVSNKYINLVLPFIDIYVYIEEILHYDEEELQYPREKRSISVMFFRNIFNIVPSFDENSNFEWEKTLFFNIFFNKIDTVRKLETGWKKNYKRFAYFIFNFSLDKNCTPNAFGRSWEVVVKNWGWIENQDQYKYKKWKYRKIHNRKIIETRLETFK